MTRCPSVAWCGMELSDFRRVYRRLWTWTWTQRCALRTSLFTSVVIIRDEDYTHTDDLLAQPVTVRRHRHPALRSSPASMSISVKRVTAYPRKCVSSLCRCRFPVAHIVCYVWSQPFDFAFVDTMGALDASTMETAEEPWVTTPPLLSSTDHNTVCCRVAASATTRPRVAHAALAPSSPAAISVCVIHDQAVHTLRIPSTNVVGDDWVTKLGSTRREPACHTILFNTPPYPTRQVNPTSSLLQPARLMPKVGLAVLNMPCCVFADSIVHATAGLS